MFCLCVYLIMPQKKIIWIYRHSLSARICHWVMALSFFYLLYSGVMIFLHFPELYWGKVGFQGHPAIFKLEDWGISWEEAERLGDRRWGRNYHYLFAWIFLINGIVYLLCNVWRKAFYLKMFPKLSELSYRNLKSVFANHIRSSGKKVTSEVGYNVIQKLSYIFILFVLFPFMIASGLAQMPAFTAISPELIDLFGGRQTARTLHVVCTVLMILFFIIHLVQVFAVGAKNQVRAMITGNYERPESELEIPK